MKDKILFWIDIEFIYFGIAKFLYEKYDCDMYSIIDVNEKAKKFFEEQQMVKFEKKWFYLDNIVVDETEPNFEYLSSVEKNYKINIWNLAYTERSFYRFNEFHKFKYEEILKIIEQECKFFENVLDEIKPNYIIMKITDWHHNHLFYEICKAKGIKILMLVPSRFGFRFIISDQMDKVDSIKTQLNSISLNDKTENNLKNYKNNYNAFNQANKYKNNKQKHNWKKLIFVLQFFLDIGNKNYRKRYSNFNRTRSKILISEFKKGIDRKIREYFINRNFSYDINSNDSFVFFPLHFEPERTLSIDAPFYTNQLEVITNIAKSLPIDYVLYVKEHPTMGLLGWRPISYYKSILDLPNVKLIHPSVNPDKIYEKCGLVITLTGTAGLEAAFHNKPSIILANVLYSDLSSVHKINSFEELPNAIRTVLSEKVNQNDLYKFVDFIDKNSFEIDINQLRTDFSNNFYYGGFLVDNPLSISKIDSFLNKHKKEFELLAEEHIKKIKSKE